MSDGLIKEAWEALERAERLNDTEEAEPFFKWAHRVDQWIYHDLPRLGKGFEAAQRENERLQENNKRADHERRFDLERALWGRARAAKKKSYPAPWESLLVGVEALAKEHERLEWMVVQMRDSERMKLAEARWEEGPVVSTTYGTATIVFQTTGMRFRRTRLGWVKEPVGQHWVGFVGGRR